MANVSKKAADSAVFIPNYDRTSARSASRNVWLTFDDGPHPSHTDTILKTLDRYTIKATFFVLGRVW
jgi:peptidoglycan/xylan/chitin deacetylase (PgdA/CDA1 family)